MRSFIEVKDILNATTIASDASPAAGGVGSPVYAADFRHGVISLDTADSTIATIQVYGSIQTTPPDFSASQAEDNQYAPLALINLDTGSSIPGSTGIVLNTDEHANYSVNVDGMTWISALITSYTHGSIWVRIKLFNDE